MEKWLREMGFPGGLEMKSLHGGGGVGDGEEDRWFLELTQSFSVIPKCYRSYLSLTTRPIHRLIVLNLSFPGVISIISIISNFLCSLTRNITSHNNHKELGFSYSSLLSSLKCQSSPRPSTLAWGLGWGQRRGDNWHFRLLTQMKDN